MSLPTRNFLTDACFKRICGCSYICNEFRFRNALYHTCLNNSNKTLLKELKYKKIEKRQIVLPSYLKTGYLNLNYTFKNLLTFDFKYLPLIPHPQLTKTGFLWYNTFEEINVQEFFTLLNMPDTFFSRFKVIELHIWMLLHVLPQSERKWKLIRYALIQALWDDTQARAKLVAESDRNYRKNIRHMYERFKVSLILYDFGYSKNDMSLADAIWNNFFSKQDIDPRYLEAMVYFIRAQINHLNSLKIENIEKPQPDSKVWLPLTPHINEVFKIT